MISEQEAKEAAARIVAYETGTPLSRVYLHAIDPIEAANNDAWDLARLYMRELARRESERVERAKPIDAEWCVANGAVNVDGCNMFRWMLKVVRVDWDEHNGTTIDGTDFNWVFLPSIKTRGQLLDLLAALRGTERPA